MQSCPRPAKKACEQRDADAGRWEVSRMSCSKKAKR